MSDTGRGLTEVAATRVSLRQGKKRGAWLGWASGGLGLLPVLVIMIGALFFPSAETPWWAPYLMLSWAAAAATGLAALAAPGTQQAEGARVKSDGERLTIRGETMGDVEWEIPLAEVVRGTLIPGFGLRLETEEGGSLDVETSSQEDAAELLAAAGLGVEERRFESAFEASSLSGMVVFLSVIALLAFAAGMASSPSQLTPLHAITWLGLAAAVFGGAYLGTRAPKIEVGADGIEVTRRRARRFLRYEEIAGAEVSGRRLVLSLHQGEPVIVAIPRGNEAQTAGLLRRIELALAAHAEAPEAPARLALLDRRARPLAAWREELERAVHDDVGYRRQPLSQDDLEAILASPQTSSERRIGAALALRALDGDAASPRIRVAAEICAEDPTRHALLRIADEAQDEGEDEAALEEAIAAATHRVA
ncbi:MAG: hypothetical protein KC731_24750 [Myxococcales bacterium]|nr:hypothetical protein [Myxococcales bacterium]